MKFQNLRITQHIARVGNLASAYQSLHFRKYCPRAGWCPNVNVFLYDDRYRVIVELAGVAREQVEVKVESQALTFRGVRALPEPASPQTECRQVLALELENGPFERRIDFALPVHTGTVTARQDNGLLIIDLPLRQQD